LSFPHAGFMTIFFPPCQRGPPLVPLLFFLVSPSSLVLFFPARGNAIIEIDPCSSFPFPFRAPRTFFPQNANIYLSFFVEIYVILAFLTMRQVRNFFLLRRPQEQAGYLSSRRSFPSPSSLTPSKLVSLFVFLHMRGRFF